MEISYFIIWLFIELGVLLLVDFFTLLDSLTSSYHLRKFLTLLLRMNLIFSIGTAVFYWFFVLSYVFVISPYIPA